MLDILNLSTLATLGYIDYVSYKIPNVILVGWVGALAAIQSLHNVNSITPVISTQTIIASLLVAGSYFPLNHIVHCYAGDFKLYGVLTVAEGFNDALTIIFISCLISLFPIASGIKKVPLAFMTFFGYIAFILLKHWGIYERFSFSC